MPVPLSSDNSTWKICRRSSKKIFEIAKFNKCNIYNSINILFILKVNDNECLRYTVAGYRLAMKHKWHNFNRLSALSKIPIILYTFFNRFQLLFHCLSIGQWILNCSAGTIKGQRGFFVVLNFMTVDHSTCYSNWIQTLLV